MNSKKTFYWVAQSLGWLLYVVLVVLVGFLGGNYSYVMLEAGLILWFLGIVVSHTYRYFIVRWGWLQMPLLKVVPLVLLASVICSFLYFFLQGLWFDAFITEINPMLTSDLSSSLTVILNSTFLFLFWSVIYFSVYYFLNYKRQEIENLKFQAARHEMELNNLKSQLNPHFMFNAMNSIRALVDEDPTLAKNAVTQLSSLLRSTLMLGKKHVVTLNEELTVVKNYLALEKIRYEERLSVSYNIDNNTLEKTIPPLMLQTLVENAIKHGVSKLARGGSIKIQTHFKRKYWVLEILNSGEFTSEKSDDTGIGLSNTRERLKLVFGAKAKIKITNEEQMVVARITIPLTYENESLID